MSEIFKISVWFSDAGQMGICDGIEWQGKIWLVPHWIDNPATQKRQPVRIVHVGAAGLRPTALHGCRYTVEFHLLPKAVLEGRQPPAPPIEAIESPCLEFPIPRRDLN